MKKLITSMVLGAALISNSVWAAEPVVSPESIEPKGYMAIGYELNMIKFPGLKEGELGGLNVEFGQEIYPWLDVAFNVGTTGTTTLSPKQAGDPKVKVHSNYVLSGLIRPKLEPFAWLNLHLTAGYFYRDYQLKIDGTAPVGVDPDAFSKNRYAQGLALGGGMQFRFAKHHAVQLEYLSYDRNSDFDEDSFDWAAAMVHYQYHW